MSSEFNLSEKIRNLPLSDYNYSVYKDEINIEDVKEFIRRLIEKIDTEVSDNCNGEIGYEEFERGFAIACKNVEIIIDKLIGSKLVEK